jgi:23S rRNA-/tRNA-specific pseudouridylate synthase
MFCRLSAMHAGSIQVLEETEDIIAVNKPAAMPVHVAGQYRKNTVVGILEASRFASPCLTIVHLTGIGFIGLLQPIAEGL